MLNNKLKILIEGISYVLTVYLIILLTFRQLRFLFSHPKVGEGEIVGYAQYFGYPMYFETALFFVFIFTPIIVFFALSKIRKYRK